MTTRSAETLFYSDADFGWNTSPIAWNPIVAVEAVVLGQRRELLALADRFLDRVGADRQLPQQRREAA